MNKRIIQFIVISFFIVCQSLLYAAEKYKFVKMWPDCKQWHFSPSSIAIDKENYVYVLDAWGGSSGGNAFLPSIMKYDSVGNLVAQWGGYGKEQNNFVCSGRIVIDREQKYVYISWGNGLIQKFTTEGKFIKTWQVESPGSLAIDLKGDIYVQTTKDVQKFNSEGVLLESFAIQGIGITVDKEGNIWVLSSDCMLPSDTGYLSPVRKYSKQGKIVKTWQTLGEDDMTFIEPHAISVDQEGFVYVIDANTSSNPSRFGNSNIVQKFDENGALLMQIGECGHDEGQFYDPSGIAFDSNGNVWVSDSGRVQKFDKEGKFICAWDNGASSKPGKFYYGPNDIFVDYLDNVYVIDFQENWVNYIGPTRVQKFNAESKFLSEWVDEESGWERHSMGFSPIITMDIEGNIYVDSNVYGDESQPNVIIDKIGLNVKEGDGWEVLKKEVGFPASGESPSIINASFSRTIHNMCVDKNKNLFFVVLLETGAYILKITDKNNIVNKINLTSNLLPFDDPFDHPRFLYLDLEENIYVITEGGILKYSNQLNFIKKIDVNSNISVIGGMAFDKNSNIYLTDNKRNCIVKLNKNGKEITRWGQEGLSQGEFNRPAGIGVDSKGNVYVADTDNHRVQKFAPVQ